MIATSNDCVPLELCNRYWKKDCVPCKRVMPLLVAILWLIEPSCHASESLRPSLRKIADVVSQIIKTRGSDSISIGQFTGPPTFVSSSGPGIQIMLQEEFKSVGVAVKKFGAPMGIRGQYLFVAPADGGDQAEQQIRLQVVLTDSGGQALTTLNQEVKLAAPADAIFPDNGNGQKIDIKDGTIDVDTFTGGEEAAALLGVTWDFERGGLKRFVDGDVVKKSFSQSTAFVDQATWLRASATSPYALQLIVNGQPRGIKLEEGQPFAELKEGETFQLNLRNSANHDIGAVFTLDGVNVFHFSESRRPDGSRLSRYIVTRGNTLPLAGWHKNMQTITSFKVTDFSQGAAALANSESGLGAITVLIRASWTPQQGPPKDEPMSNMVGSAAPTGPAIGFGDDVRQQSQIATNRENGVVRAILTLRYTKK